MPTTATSRPRPASSLLRRVGSHLLGRLRALAEDIFRARRRYVLPLEGGLFIVVTLAIGLAAMNTATQLLFLVFSMMCAFWTLSALMATTSLRQVKVERAMPRLAVAGEPVTIALRAVNTKRWFDSFSLRATDHLSGGRRIGAAFFVRVPRRGVSQATYRCLFPQRGLHVFESIALATRFPFGLIERTIERRVAGELLVLPQVFAIPRPLATWRAALGEDETNRRGAGSSLYALRDYQPGESARDIHWRVSARRGRLITREYEAEERRRVSLLLDNRALWSEATARQFERGVVLAASVVAYLLEQGHQVELVTASGKVPFGEGAPHLMRVRRALATVALLDPAKASPHLPPTEADSLRMQVLYGVGQAPASDGDILRVSVDEFATELDATLG